jgi:exodeoxyribonuclease VII large subunit
VAQHRAKLDDLSRCLEEAQAARIKEAKRSLEALDRLRETLGYRETLRRGYAVVRGESGVLTRKAAAETAGALEIEFHDGRLKIGGGAPRKGGAKPRPPEQGSLF